ncbi:MAG: PqqD family protein [Phocaeicola sp.]|nr:PqqD family protein [Phocaeicola sp.]MDD7447660.1 PqqD family protein [Prevotellaceae bacterium]MDY3913413.1 PqqD family protein [Phocaeicola sp.]MDY5938888.1 PqqD family protein [Phocaeicola sp.]
MRFKENISIKKIGTEAILVSNDAGNISYTRVISLNKSAEFLIANSLGKDFSTEEWAEKLVDKYQIDKSLALKDVQVLVEQLTQAGALL